MRATGTFQLDLGGLVAMRRTRAFGLGLLVVAGLCVGPNSYKSA